MLMKLAKRTLKYSQRNNLGEIECEHLLLDLYSSIEVEVLSTSHQSSNLNISGNRD